jgi:hypothetical protein
MGWGFVKKTRVSKIGQGVRRAKSITPCRPSVEFIQEENRSLQSATQERSLGQTIVPSFCSSQKRLA